VNVWPKNSIMQTGQWRLFSHEDACASYLMDIVAVLDLFTEASLPVTRCGAASLSATSLSYHGDGRNT
jgi:hypothetical protein